MKHRDREGGEAAFCRHYEAVYRERWPALMSALRGEADSVAYDAGGAEAYRLDSASVFAARALVLPAAGELLDACAAPGGKSVVIASRMGADLRLIANELSSERRRRLVDALNRSLSPSVRARVVVSGEDAAAMCRRNVERFGAILLDAPCSSERHVLADPAALAAWTEARPRQLAQRQWALLSSAFLMLKPGGCLVYATCSINPAENDGIIARLDAKHGGRLRFDAPECEEGERTAYGVLVLPDRSGGAGPMYVCRVFKTEADAGA